MDLTDSETSKLKNAKSAEEWNAACDDIKKARAGQYPPNWFSAVIASGLMSEARIRFAAGSAS